MKQPITEDQWDDWKSHPVTEKVFKYFFHMKMGVTHLIEIESRKIPVTQEQITKSTIERIILVEREDNFKDLANLTQEVINSEYGVEEEKEKETDE